MSFRLLFVVCLDITLVGHWLVPKPDKSMNLLSYGLHRFSKRPWIILNPFENLFEDPLSHTWTTLPTGGSQSSLSLQFLSHICMILTCPVHRLHLAPRPYLVELWRVELIWRLGVGVTVLPWPWRCFSFGYFLSRKGEKNEFWWNLCNTECHKVRTYPRWV